MAFTESRNLSTVTHFILLGFSNDHNAQIALFLIFLVDYVVLLAANILLILAVTIDPRLHNPMYFFIINLSIINICGPSVIIPRMLADFLSANKSILFSACATQMFFNSVLGGSECILLVLMAYDRYVAICKPLRYNTIMTISACKWMITVTWIVSAILSSVDILHLCRSTFCGPNIINHFYCQFISLRQLCCSDTSAIYIQAFIGAATFLLVPLLLIILSYYKILASIKRIQSERYKAFSSCTSHLIVVTLFYGMALVTSMTTKTSADDNREMVVSAFYVIIIPMLNPIIYSLRNRDVHRAVRLLGKWRLQFSSMAQRLRGNQ